MRPEEGECGLEEEKEKGKERMKEGGSKEGDGGEKGG